MVHLGKRTGIVAHCSEEGTIGMEVKEVRSPVSRVRQDSSNPYFLSSGNTLQTKKAFPFAPSDSLVLQKMPSPEQLGAHA